MDLTATETFFVVWNSLFTVFACGVIVEFYRRREDFFLKARIPFLSLAQMFDCMIAWIFMGIAAPLSVNPKARCYFITVWAGLFGVSMATLHVVAAWTLYWRLYISKYLARSRKLVREALEKRRASASLSKPLEIPRSRRDVLEFRVARYALGGYYAILLLVYIVLVHYQFGAFEGCTGFAVLPYQTILVFIHLPSAVIAGLFLLAKLKNFKDNFNIYLEIRYIAITYCAICPVIFGLMMYAINVDGSAWVFVLNTIPLIAQVFFIVSGVMPLRDQIKLDRKVDLCDFDHLSSFDDVLAEPAALVALEQFMCHEFTEEILEFYQAVVQYKNMHELWTSEKRLQKARVLYAQFVAPGAPSQINLSDVLVKEVRVRLFGFAEKSADASQIRDVPNNAFDAAQEEMAKLIQAGPFIRFQLHRAHGDLPSVDRRSSRGSRGSISSRKSSVGTFGRTRRTSAPNALFGAHQGEHTVSRDRLSTTFGTTEASRAPSKSLTSASAHFV